MKVISVVGARPQFVKVALVVKELAERGIEAPIVHTGQHYDYEMSALFFKELEIPEPVVNLNVGSGTHAEQTSKMLLGLEKILLRERPHAIIVYGDTNSTLAGALSAAKLNITICHVEAGLRSYNRKMPEEINRIVSDHLSDVLFAPTRHALEILKREGLGDKAHMVGDVMYDVLLRYMDMSMSSTVVEKMGLEPKKYYLATVHRAENTDDPKRLSDIISALSALDLPVIFPAHPRTKKRMEEYGIKMDGSIRLVSPMSYLEFITLLRYAAKVLTDSGGVQKEAYVLGVPCITLRDETEWVETVEDGWNILVGASRDRIITAVAKFSPKGERKKHYGDGYAHKRIADVVEGL
ncbi:MAG: UDP-N-acetylglucosamine 2-epimerase (non-hydrolyzing) [Thermoplasmata archaeon]|nr:MAG: UDP-N-acetylglucosamine 2-epimerase (non-hydrolyzing) [Thermoplasmata archaeon]